MREILFRGKRIDNGEWVEGDFCRCGVAKIDTHKMGQPWRGYTVHEESIGQFTGLRDKNGRRIFEGDILALGKLSTEPVFVTFDYFGWVCKTPKYPTYRHWLEENPSKYKVVGNIHDNPELLKEA